MADADAARVTHCQLEAHVHFASLVSHEPEGAACPKHKPALRQYMS